jgi:hypothetical protein
MIKLQLDGLMKKIQNKEMKMKKSKFEPWKRNTARRPKK